MTVDTIELSSVWDVVAGTAGAVAIVSFTLLLLGTTPGARSESRLARLQYAAIVVLMLGFEIDLVLDTGRGTDVCLPVAIVLFVVVVVLRRRRGEAVFVRPIRRDR
ncbi:hypothetical protein ACVU7I_02295 [Patulibacter sp. S7RM1-6]